MNYLPGAHDSWGGSVLTCEPKNPILLYSPRKTHEDELDGFREGYAELRRELDEFDAWVRSGEIAPHGAHRELFYDTEAKRSEEARRAPARHAELFLMWRYMKRKGVARHYSSHPYMITPRERYAVKDAGKTDGVACAARARAAQHRKVAGLRRRLGRLDQARDAATEATGAAGDAARRAVWAARAAVRRIRASRPPRPPAPRPPAPRPPAPRPPAPSPLPPPPPPPLSTAETKEPDDGATIAAADEGPALPPPPPQPAGEPAKQPAATAKAERTKAPATKKGHKRKVRADAQRARLKEQGWTIVEKERTVKGRVQYSYFYYAPVNRKRFTSLKKAMQHVCEA